MKQQHTTSQEIPYPKMRRWMAAAYRSVIHTPQMHGLIEVDVTRARARLREHRTTTGESLSFTAFLIVCLAKAVEEHKAVQALRKGSRHLVLFDEVDVYLPIESEVDGQKQFTNSIIRAANRKTVHEIHQEIRAAQSKDVEQALKGFKRLLLFLPPLLFLPFFRVCLWLFQASPQVKKNIAGTVGLTAVGMFGKGAGWGIPPANAHPLWITVGGIGKKPGIVDGEIAIRDYLSLTITFNHEIIDGAPAARFTERLKELIESGYGLFDSTIESEQAITPQIAWKRG
jgi:pyruvate/2-oxoglutarate dehydrogenase complex dihydrolipoamide acyltransferase (E2) component